MPTCPNCGHEWSDEKARERRARYEEHRPPRGDARRAYLRDYARGRRHAAAGKARERGASDAYRAGYSAASDA